MAFLTVGDLAPWFTLPSTSNPRYNFDTVGGHRVLLFFFGSSQVPQVKQVLQEFLQQQPRLAELGVPFFGVSISPEDAYLAEAIETPTYCKFLWDFERQVSCLYGVCQTEEDMAYYAPTVFLLNERLQIVQIFPLSEAEGYVDRILSWLAALPAIEPHRMATRQAPALCIPQVFDREFCQTLIQFYEAEGGEDSGFMREVGGKTVAILDPGFKKRRDVLIEDAALLNKINDFVIRRIKPEVERAFQFSITRFERHLIACYDSSNQGFFNRHRDNTTRGTAHRRFAMTLNLNTDEYEGGCLWFPEHGSSLYRPETGEAIIFSCSLLHEVTPVTQGRRFALLSFFYDDEGAKIREQNRKYLSVERERSTPPEAVSEADRTPPESAAKEEDEFMAGKPTKAERTAALGFQPKPKKKL
ncbi:MAG: hypothetical protein Kow00121_20410 [Elainellaceae cyanobacterium]